jgi:hypothetical protein
MEINKCVCGCSAKLMKKSIVFGHGSYGQEFWVESDCGLRGKIFDTYDINDETASKKAVEFWNSHFSG